MGDRQLFEGGERGVTDTKIIERDGDPELTQATQ
jgi:hypothetical protein